MTDALIARNTIATIDAMPFRPRWTPSHTTGATIAIASGLIAMCLQIATLSGWHLGSAPENITLTPANAPVTRDASGAIRFEFVGVAAVAASRGLNIATDQVLALEFAVDQIPDRATLTLGWTTTRDLRRPASIVTPLPPSATAKTVTVMLRGNPLWRDNAITLAVAMTAPTGSNAITVSSVAVVPATPVSSAMLSAQQWFDSGRVLSAVGNAQRILPLAFWFVIVSALALGAIAWLKREQPAARADAIIGAAIAIALVAIIATVLSPHALTMPVAALAWIAAALAVVATASPWRKIKAIVERLSAPIDAALACGVSIALSAVAVAIAGIAIAWIFFAVALLLAGRFAPQIVSRLSPLLLFAPLVLAGAVMQDFLPVQTGLSSLRDPSANLAGMVARAAAIPALAIAALLAHRAWPSIAASARFSLPAGLASGYAIIGTTLAMALPDITREAITGTGAAWLVLPVIACIGLFVWPAFQSRATTSIARVEAQKTEADLSAIVRALFDGAAGSFDHALDTAQPGNALAPLKRMQDIAPASLITHAAQLRYALATRKLATGRDSFALLKAQSPGALPDGAIAIIANYANDTGDFDAVLSYASLLPATESTLRAIAHAQLMVAIPDTDKVDAARVQAIATLSSHTDAQTFAREIAELHLLADDWQSAQKAMVNTGIDLQTLEGQVYVSRLGLRAAGATGYAKSINDNAMWHADLGIAQAALGELLLAQGNANGARARFLLALKLDAALWPLQTWIKAPRSAQLAPSTSAHNVAPTPSANIAS
jgi:tetratricopeptide (TPR) repeat protein